MDYIKAFVTGGLLCAAVQILMDKTKLMPGRIMVLLVVCGSVLGAIGLYEPYAKWAGSGATVPLLGFGNTLWKGVRDGIDKDGVLGLFTGGFTAGAAGISGALIFRLSVVADLQTQDEGLERRRKKSKRKQGKRKSVEEIKSCCKRGI